MNEFAKQTKQDPNDIKTQLDFTIHEFKTTETDENYGLPFAKILLKVVMYPVFWVDKQLPNQSQCIVHPIGVADFSCVNGSFNGCLFHISLFLPFRISFLTKMGSPKAAQHKYHTILDIHLSILTFSNFLHHFLWNIPSWKKRKPDVLWRYKKGVSPMY